MNVKYSISSNVSVVIFTEEATQKLYFLVSEDRSPVVTLAKYIRLPASGLVQQQQEQQQEQQAELTWDCSKENTD